MNTFAELKPNQPVYLTTIDTHGGTQMVHTGIVVNVDGPSTLTLRNASIYDPELTIGEASNWYDMDEVTVGWTNTLPTVRILQDCKPGCVGSCCHDYS